MQVLLCVLFQKNVNFEDSNRGRGKSERAAAWLYMQYAVRMKIFLSVLRETPKEGNRTKLFDVIATDPNAISVRIT